MDTTALTAALSSQYAKTRPQYPDALFEYISSLSLNHQAAWDCGTGNGQAALGLAKYFRRVQATDIDDQQLAQAYQAPGVHFSTQAAEFTQFNDSVFDLVNISQALHWFDLQSFWKELKRVSKPTAVVVAYGYQWTQVGEEIDQCVQTPFRRTIDPYISSKARLCSTGYRDLAPPFDCICAPDFAMLEHWTADQYVDYMASWSASKICLQVEGPSFIDNARAAAQALWGAETRPVIIPLQGFIGYPHRASES